VKLWPRILHHVAAFCLGAGIIACTMAAVRAYRTILGGTDAPGLDENELGLIGFVSAAVASFVCLRRVWRSIRRGDDEESQNRKNVVRERAYENWKAVQQEHKTS
jgi:hypothetical protein